MPSFAQADVLIASHGRSGSTMLADLLTTSPSRAVWTEPCLATLGQHVREQTVRMGLPAPGAAEEWEACVGLSESRAAERLERLLGPAIAGLSRWGVKEVSPDWLEPSFRLLRPRRVVLLVRNLADAGASLYVKSERARGTPAFRDEAWMVDRFRRALIGLEQIAQRAEPSTCRWVAYEDLVSSSDAREDLGGWLDWPLDGVPGARLDLYGREHELERHGARVSSASIGRYERGADSACDAFLERLFEACAGVVSSVPEALGLARAG